MINRPAMPIQHILDRGISQANQINQTPSRDCATLATTGPNPPYLFGKAIADPVL
jgi:hypothetical protein